MVELSNRVHLGNPFKDDLRLAAFDRIVSEAILEIKTKRRDLSEDDFIRWIRSKPSIITNGLYSIHINEWLKIGFKRSQMLIINGDEFNLNPSRTIREIQLFMGLEPIIKEDNFRIKNEQSLCFVNGTTEIDCISKKPG